MNSNMKRVSGLRLALALLFAAMLASLAPGARAQSANSPTVLPPDRQPIFCTEQYEPVCGRIGDNYRIYSNACFAKAAGASVVADGPCKLGHQGQPVE